MIASLREEAQPAQRRARCGKISFWERKLAVRSKIVCGKCGRRIFETIPAPNEQENINLV
jgi:hypothetical protein